MRLPSSRRREESFFKRESAGETLWTWDFDERALRRLDVLWAEVDRDYYNSDHAETVEKYLTREGGWSMRYAIGTTPHYDYRERGSEFIADLLAAIVGVLHHETQFIEDVNRVLREHRINYVAVGDELLPRSFDELDRKVVHPALGLLVAGEFSSAHALYLKSIKEIQHGNPGGAITVAASAFQQVLETLGCEGNALGPLIRSARRKGLFAAHDTPLVEAIEKTAHWVSADRSETGDSHHSSSAEIPDAWLIVHVVGALIVRLVDPGSTRAEES